MTDHISLPTGSALVERKTCDCGESITLYRGVWWDDDDSPHECDEPESDEDRNEDRNEGQYTGRFSEKVLNVPASCLERITTPDPSD
jgi:hypothetical protein